MGEQETPGRCSWHSGGSGCQRPESRPASPCRTRRSPLDLERVVSTRSHTCGAWTHTSHLGAFPSLFRSAWRVLLFLYCLLSQLLFYPKRVIATFTILIMWLMIRSCFYSFQPMEIPSHLLMQLNCLLDVTQSFLQYNSTRPSARRPILAGLYQCVPWTYHFQHLLSFNGLLRCLN